jgi:hypothetical protein
MRHLATLAFIGTSLVTTACARNATNDDPDSPTAAVDSEESTESEGNVVMASVDGADQTAAPDVVSAGSAAPTPLTIAGVVARITANVNARWSPVGCATVSSSGANVAIKYNDCTGPRGLVHVSGELDLTISISSANEVQVQATATGFDVNRAVLDIDANATYVSAGAGGSADTLTVSSNGTGVGPLGTDIDHNGDYTVSWDPSSQCGSIDGTWSTDFSNGSASAERSNDVDVSRCAGGCPTGTMTHHFLLGATLTLTFNGTNVATWATSAGKSGTFNLSCQ